MIALIQESEITQLERSGPHLGDGDGLLLHDLVDGRAVSVSHLIKLVDAAHAQIG